MQLSSFVNLEGVFMYKNNFIILPLSLLTAVFTTTNGMEIVPSNLLPTIKAKLYISNYITTAYYTGNKELKSMNEAGIKSSIQNQQKMPLIPVIVRAEKRD